MRLPEPVHRHRLQKGEIFTWDIGIFTSFHMITLNFSYFLLKFTAWINHGVFVLTNVVEHFMEFWSLFDIINKFGFQYSLK